MEGSSLLSHSCCSSPTLKPHLSFSLSFTLSSSSSSSLLFGKSHLLGLIQRPLLATVSLSSPRTSLRTSTFTLDEALENPNSDSREMLPKIDKSGRFCSPRAARELALSIVYAACLEGSDPVRLFEKRMNVRREPGYEFDRASLLEYNPMSFGGPPVTVETVEEADELLRNDEKESAIEAEVLAAPPKLVYSKLILRFTRKLLVAVMDKWDSHVLVIDKVAPPNWKDEPAGRILELCILHLAMSEITVLETRHPIVINEAVDLAKRFCDGSAPRVINGCLRTFVKGIEETGGLTTALGYKQKVVQTERQRLLLLDTSKSPVESIRAGGRYDFIVEHDVKELGAHTLVCTALYYDGDGERKYLPQFFKFIVANPLSVRTKVRVVKEITFLEACIENHTKSNLFMDQVEFEPAQHWSAKILKADEHHSDKYSRTRETFKSPILIKSGGGIHNYLYQLKSLGSAQTKVEGSNILGKLQITWRTNLGEPGRLQTQQIMGTPIIRKDIELHVVEVPSAIKLERPFSLHLKLANETDKELGPFEVWLSQDDSREEKKVVINGLQTVVLPRVEAFGSTDFHLNLISTQLGVQRITGITVFNTREKQTYDPLPDLEIFVDLD